MTTLASLVLAAVCGLPLLILIWILSRTSSSSKRDSAADSASSSPLETDGGEKNRQEGVYEKEGGEQSGFHPCDDKRGAGRPQGVLGDINSNIPLSKHLAGVTRARDPGQKYDCDNGSVAGDIRRLQGGMGNTQEGETSSHQDEEVEATEQQTPLTSTPLNKQLKPISGGVAASRRSGDGQSLGCDAKVRMRGDELQEMSPITENSILSVKGGKDSSDSVVCDDTFVMHSDASLLGSSPGRRKDQEKCSKCKEAGFSSSLVREARNAMQEKYEDYCRFLREQLEKEGREKERAQEWSEFLCLELDAHINARIHAEDKYSQLLLRSKYLTERYKRMHGMYSSLKKELDSLVGSEPTNEARCSGEAEEVASDMVERKENPVLCLPPSTEKCSASDREDMEDSTVSEDQSHSGEPRSSDVQELTDVNCSTDNDVLIVVTDIDSSVQETPQSVHRDTQGVSDQSIDLSCIALSDTFVYEDENLLSHDVQTAPASADQLLAAYEAETAGDSDIDDLVEIAKAVRKEKVGRPKKKSTSTKRKHNLPRICLSQSTSQFTLSEPSFNQNESASDMSEEMLRSWASHLVNNVIHDVIQREYKGQHLFRDLQEVESTWEATYSAAHSSPRGSPNRTPSFSEFCSFSQSEDVEANILEELAVYNIHARSSAPHADKLTENSPRAQPSTGAQCDSRLLVSDGLVARTRADVNASPSRDSDGQLNEDDNTAVSMQERKALWEEKLSWKRGHDVTKHVTDVGGAGGGLKRTKQILEENLNVSSDSSNGTNSCDKSVDLGLDGSHNVQQTKQMWQELATQKTSPDKPVNGHCSPNKSPDRTESSNKMQLKLQQWENYQENGTTPESPRENDLGAQLYEHDEDKIDVSNEHMSSFVFSTSIRNVKQTKSKWETLMADASPEADVPDNPKEDVGQPPASAAKSTSFIRGTKFASLKDQWQQK